MRRIEAVFEDMARQPVGAGGRHTGRAGGAGASGGVESSDLLERLEARVDEEVAKYVSTSAMGLDSTRTERPSLALVF